MYNECSLRAISNWALPSGATNNTLVETTETKESQHGDANTTIKKNLNLKRVSYMPTASTTFRKCGACNKYGHYEVECEQLMQKRVKKNVKISKWLCSETKVQNVLRQFASPFTSSPNDNN